MTEPRIAVIDYHKGNLKSVEQGLQKVGARAFIADNPAKIAEADALVLPGVGAFADAVNAIDELGQRDAIMDSIGRERPFLGICLGMQLMFAAGTEGAVEGGELPRGLGILPGTADRMPNTDADGNAYKVPHVGWNSIDFSRARTTCPLIAGIQPGEFFYFTHSYTAPLDADAVATTTHSATFPSVVQADNVFGVQFHPEKSSDAGLRVLKNFLNIVEGR